ncbi:MAG: adenylate/guanylate cyclase domain-containing protein [Anaerolineae bacterium]|nr:adenylate/guanylate cyclase domain-containing protein [Anaerolineae bacterium]
MPHVLSEIEPRLRWLLPADLYAAGWLNPSRETLTRVFEHLRTLLSMLQNYVPRQVAENPPTLGQPRHEWQSGTLMFTDLAGFTPLMEANAARGRDGAESLLGTLNVYFAEMIEIIGKAGGNLLEFTGDALLAQFPAGRRGNDTERAVRAGLRMQRAMTRFACIDVGGTTLSLGMRIGLHSGRFLTADIGTPRRMEHVLLGSDVHLTKLAEGAGQVGRVCLTAAARARIERQFRFEPGQEGHFLVVDDLTEEQLGEYDLLLNRRRMGNPLLIDRSEEGIVREIASAVAQIEPLASYMPMPVLNLVVESAAERQIPPDFLRAIVLFVNLIGLAETVAELPAGGESALIDRFSHIFALINAAVEERGGVLKKVTYHLVGSDMMIYFGPPSGHSDDPERAASTAREIRKLIAENVRDNQALTCKIGLASGTAFAAEIGDPRGRREFNVLSDTVNTAARLMSKAAYGQILLTGPVYERVADHFECQSLGEMPLKGKSQPMPIFALR